MEGEVNPGLISGFLSQRADTARSSSNTQRRQDAYLRRKQGVKLNWNRFGWIQKMSTSEAVSAAAIADANRWSLIASHFSRIPAKHV